MEATTYTSQDLKAILHDALWMRITNEAKRMKLLPEHGMRDERGYLEANADSAGNSFITELNSFCHEWVVEKNKPEVAAHAIPRWSSDDNNVFRLSLWFPRCIQREFMVQYEIKIPGIVLYRDFTIKLPTFHGAADITSALRSKPIEFTTTYDDTLKALDHDTNTPSSNTLQRPNRSKLSKSYEDKDDYQHGGKHPDYKIYHEHRGRSMSRSDHGRKYRRDERSRSPYSRYDRRSRSPNYKFSHEHRYSRSGGHGNRSYSRVDYRRHSRSPDHKHDRYSNRGRTRSPAYKSSGRYYSGNRSRQSPTPTYYRKAQYAREDRDYGTYSRTRGDYGYNDNPKRGDHGAQDTSKQQSQFNPNLVPIPPRKRRDVGATGNPIDDDDEEQISFRGAATNRGGSSANFGKLSVRYRKWHKMGHHAVRR